MENPYQPPQPAVPAAPVTPTAPAPGCQGVLRPLYDVKGWMKFLGILNIIAGIIYCITIIGAIIGWLPILIGVKLKNAARKIEAGCDTANDALSYQGLKDLATVIMIFGILAIIGLVFNVIYFFIIVFALLAGALH